MALNFDAVQKAYTVFNELKRTVLPNLTIYSWPSDMSEWSENERKNPDENKVYGFDKKQDDGWEELVFFIRNPSEELKQKFNEIKEQVPNSSTAEPYNANPDLWIFGWF